MIRTLHLARALLAPALLALLAMPAAAQPGGGETTELTVTSWGGAYSFSQIKAYHEPYMAENPDVVLRPETYSGGLAEIRAQTMAGNVTWDVLDATMSDAIQGCEEGLFMPLDHSALASAPDGTPARADFIDGALTDCAVTQIVYSTVLGYRTDAWGGRAPRTIHDLFDLENFPGKRALQKKPINNLEWALIADGVPRDEVYDVLDTEAGIDRAFAKLDSIKDEVVWWTVGARPPQLLADGEVVMASGYNGRLFDAKITQDQPIDYLWHSQALTLDTWVIPAFGDNTGAAWEFVKFATTPEALARQARYIAYGPARKSSQQMVGTHYKTGIEMAPRLPTRKANLEAALWFNYEWWADNRDRLDARFNAWLAK